jgi:hypothetical protein
MIAQTEMEAGTKKEANILAMVAIHKTTDRYINVLIDCFGFVQCHLKSWA